MDLATPPVATAATAAEPMGRRERKKLETRRAIRKAALELFAERGFDAATIADITEAADVAPRTFFLHYSSKEEVLLGDARDRVAEFERMMRERPADDDPFTAVREVALSGMVANDDVPEDEHVLAARLMANTPHLLGRVFEQYAEFEQTIARSVAERYGYDDDTYPRLLAACAMTAVRVGHQLWHARGHSDPLDRIVVELFDQLGHGLSRAQTARPR